MQLILEKAYAPSQFLFASARLSCISWLYRFSVVVAFGSLCRTCPDCCAYLNLASRMYNVWTDTIRNGLQRCMHVDLIDALSCRLICATTIVATSVNVIWFTWQAELQHISGSCIGHILLFGHTCICTRADCMLAWAWSNSYWVVRKACAHTWVTESAILVLCSYKRLTNTQTAHRQAPACSVSDKLAMQHWAQLLLEQSAYLHWQQQWPCLFAIQ